MRSTEVLFLFSETQAGTSSAKEAHMLGLIELIISTYSTGLICYKINTQSNHHNRIDKNNKLDQGFTKSRPQRVSKEAPILLLAPCSGMLCRESLATAAKPYLGKPTTLLSPPRLAIFFADRPSKLRRETEKYFSGAFRQTVGVRGWEKGLTSEHG